MSTSIRRGFKEFRKPEVISDEKLEADIVRLRVEGRYIYWTGEDYKFRANSLRSRALKALKTKNRPVPLADWLRLAARVVSPEEKIGFDPAATRAGLVLHHDSKPAVYFELKKDDKGNYVSVRTIPNIIPTIKEGDVIFEAEEEVEPARIEVSSSGTEIIETAESARENVARAARVKGKRSAGGPGRRR